MVDRQICGILGRYLGVLGILTVLFLLASQALAVEQPKLRDRLEKGLRARTAADFSFLERVVERVEAGDLPEELVNRVFFWARKKAELQPGSKRRRPIVYFQPALTKLAALLNVNLE